MRTTRGQPINSDYLACVWKDVERRLLRGPPTHCTTEERNKWIKAEQAFLEYVKEEFQDRLVAELGG
jgi:hypothetical protein